MHEPASLIVGDVPRGGAYEKAAMLVGVVNGRFSGTAKLFADEEVSNSATAGSIRSLVPKFPSDRGWSHVVHGLGSIIKIVDILVDAGRMFL